MGPRIRDIIHHTQSSENQYSPVNEQKGVKGRRISEQMETRNHDLSDQIPGFKSLLPTARNLGLIYAVKARGPWMVPVLVRVPRELSSRGGRIWQWT